MNTTIRKIYSTAAFILPLLLLGACSEADKSCGGDGDEVYEVSRIGMSMTETESDIQVGVTRAVSGFVVNTNDDPTYRLSQKLDWTLDMTIYKSGSPYAEGSGLFTWDGSYWTSPTQIYMPNYLTQSVEATLYPSTWTIGVSEIATDQRVEDIFRRQDILVQNGIPYYETAPAHYLKVKMRHAHSMIDFVLAEVNPADIDVVTVEAGGEVYNPYKAAVTNREEYLVILPLGTVKPVIKVTTKAGAKYSKELAINPTVINTCYYVRLVGLTLELESIAVSNWAYGQAVEGDYSTVTSYPTFRGPEGTSLKIYYDNGEDQTITFNARGEVTAKPAGRTIIRIERGALSYDFAEPYALRGMVIDLNDYIDQMV